MQRSELAPEYIPSGRVVAGAITAGATAGFVLGEISTIALPTHVTFAPGIEGDAYLSFKTQGVEASSAIAELHLPKVAVKTPLPGVNGVHINFTKLDVDTNSAKSLSKYTALVSEPKTAVAQPIKNSMYERGAEGAAVGVILTGLVGVAVLRNRWRLKELRQVLSENDQERLGFSHKHKNGLLRNRKFAGGMAILAMASGCGFVVKESSDESSKGIALPGNIVALSPDRLEDASLSGHGAKLLLSISRGVVNSIDEAKSSWQTIGYNLKGQLKDFESKGGFLFRNDPNYKSVMFMYGSACNQAFMKYTLPTAVKGLKPAFVINAGDTFTSAGTMPFEKNCGKDLQKYLGRIPQISVRGNHDPVKGQPSDLNKKNGYAKKVDGINVVGAPFDLVSTWGNTKPVSLKERKELVKKQAETIADRACEITDKSGVPPVVVTHSVDAAVNTFINGCATVIDAGHGTAPLRNPTLKAYRGTNGNTVYVQTAMAASGEDGGITLYSRPQKRATLIDQIFKRDIKGSYRFAGSITITFETDYSVSISRQELPEPEIIRGR